MEFRLCTVVFALGTLIFSLLGAAPATAQEGVAPPRIVSVSGDSEIFVQPDRARLSMYVDKLAADVKSGEAEVNRAVRTYLGEAKSLGAKDEDISTTGISIQPEYVWDEKTRQQKLAGYRLRREVAIVVRDLARLGDFILRATASGVNQVNPPVLEYSEVKRIQLQALAKAAQEARAKAQLLAETLNASLGPVRTISANDANVPPPIPLMQKSMRAEAAADSADMGIALGEIRVRAEVSVEFDLLSR